MGRKHFHSGIFVVLTTIYKTFSLYSTSGLVELQEYVNGLSTNELVKLKEQQAIAASNLMFLMNYAYLIKDDILLNDNTFSWSDRIIPIIRNRYLEYINLFI